MVKSRFQVIHHEQITLPREYAANSNNPWVQTMTLRDKETDVLYLYTQSLLGTSTMTPLLNVDGKPLIHDSTNHLTSVVESKNTKNSTTKKDPDAWSL